MELSRAKELALKHMTAHGLIAKGWSFDFDSAERRMGVCKHGPKHISISRHYTEHADEAQVVNTILHEVAHALTPGAKHGPVWKAMASRLGATPKACGKNPYYDTIRDERREAIIAKNLLNAKQDQWFVVDHPSHRTRRFRLLRENEKSLTLIDENGKTLRAPRELVTNADATQDTVSMRSTADHASWARIGSLVAFDGPKNRGRTYTVIRVNQKTLTVRDVENGLVWRVSKLYVRKAA